MTDNPRDLHNGELDNDADLDPSGTDPEAETGEGYVDPIEDDVEAVSSPQPATGPTALP